MKQHTTWQLAGLADCGSPDVADGYGFADFDTEAGDGSPGAEFLRRIEFSTYEVWDDLEDKPAPEDIWSIEDDGTVSSIADTAVAVYTHQRWAEFVDLAAYQEDVTEFGDQSEDMTTCAGVALYIIGMRLAWAILTELAEEHAEESAAA